MSGADEARTPKIRENRLRRMARRQGLVLRKSTMRDPRAPFYGTYGLVDPQTDKWVPWGGKGTVPPRDDSKGRKAGPTGVGGHAYGLTLDEIDTWLHTARPVSASRPEGPWTHDGLTPEQIAAGRWRCRWTDDDGVAHDVLALPLQTSDEARWREWAAFVAEMQVGQREIRGLLRELVAEMKAARAGLPAGHADAGWTTAGLSPDELRRGVLRRRWVDAEGLTHDVVALPIAPWPPTPGAGGSGDAPNV